MKKGDENSGSGPDEERNQVIGQGGISCNLIFFELLFLNYANVLQKGLQKENNFLSLAELSRIG